MRHLLSIVLLLWSSLASAAIINVEFKFTPFIGDSKTADRVQSVPGIARVFINNVPLTAQEIGSGDLPVLFTEREVSPSVWISAASMGSSIRHGKNKLRIEFQPSQANTPYTAQFRWASVTDQTTEVQTEGLTRITNQGDAGVDEKTATGSVVFEHEFTADFAKEAAWHRYPAITALSDADKQQLNAIVKARVDAFKPNFAGVYKLLEKAPHIKLAALRKHKCLDIAYKAGVRIAMPTLDQMDFVVTGNPEVVIQHKDGHPLYRPADPQSFQRIKNDDIQMCAGMALPAAYPARLVVVRSPAGTWELVE